MNGLKEALEYIVGLNVPNYTIDCQGRTYADKQMYRVEHDAQVEAVKLSTLDSLVEYLQKEGDERPERMYVHVKSPTEVLLIAPVEKLEDYRRNIFVTVQADLPAFPFGKFMDSETFIIMLKSMFMDYATEGIPCSGKEAVLRYAGNVQHGTLQTSIDDGVSQHAEIKVGVLQTDTEMAPSIVQLRPFRTFLEVEQPVSEFLFRIREDRGEGISCALFEADGSMWKYTAKHSIAAYLRDKLDGMDNIIILS